MTGGNVKKYIAWYAAYVVGIYAYNRWVAPTTGTPGVNLPLPIITDPLGALIGYPGLQVAS